VIEMEDKFDVMPLEQKLQELNEELGEYLKGE
jgi:hypothetical protein